MSTFINEGPAMVGLKSLNNFAAWTKLVVPEVDRLIQIDGIGWNADRGHSYVKYSGVPGGTTDGISNALLVEGISRLVTVRSRRRLHETGKLQMPPHSWEAAIIKHFGPIFDSTVRLEIGIGWFDLIATAADWIWSVDDPKSRIRFTHVQSKNGLLCLLSPPHGWPVDDIIEAMEELSRHVCEVCGAPGKSRDRGQNVLVLCEGHAKGRGSAE